MKRAHLSGLVVISLMNSGCAHDPVLSGRESLSNLLRSYQFEEVSPPSRLPAPGTIIRVIARNPLVFNTVCTSKQAFGDAWVGEVATSETVSSETKERLERTFSLGVDYKALVGSSVGARHVKGVKMTLSNAKLLLITSASARMGSANPSCLDAANFQTKMLAGEMTMITSVLQADVEYVVEFESGASLSLESKAEILKNVAGKVGGAVTDAGGGAVKGDSLIWGVRRDPVVYAQYLDARR